MRRTGTRAPRSPPPTNTRHHHHFLLERRPAAAPTNSRLPRRQTSSTSFLPKKKACVQVRVSTGVLGDVQPVFFSFFGPLLLLFLRWLSCRLSIICCLRSFGGFLLFLPSSFGRFSRLLLLPGWRDVHQSSAERSLFLPFDSFVSPPPSKLQPPGALADSCRSTSARRFRADAQGNRLSTRKEKNALMFVEGQNQL